MAVFPWWDRLNILPELPRSVPLAVRESTRCRQLVSTILLVVAGFQLVSLPGAISDQSVLALGTVVPRDTQRDESKQTIRGATTFS